jgi:DNA-binding Xre family transcriptional regulator
MKYSYNKLWKLLIDRNMKKKDIESLAEIASSTMAKMSKELPVSLEVLARICRALKVKIEDIVEIIY